MRSIERLAARLLKTKLCLLFPLLLRERGRVRGTFYACNDEAIYKAHAELNIKRLRIIVFCRYRLLMSGGKKLIFQDQPYCLLIEDQCYEKGR